MKILFCSVMQGNINKQKPLALDIFHFCDLRTVFFKTSFLNEGKEKNSDVDEQLIVFENEVNKEKIIHTT